MPLWQEMLLLIFYNILSVLVDPIFWGVVIVIGWQFFKEQRQQVQIFGIPAQAVWPKIGYTIWYSLIGGSIGSIILTVMGISINKLGLDYIWPAALLLMTIHMRFLCFAYAGGLIAISSLIFGWPDVYVPQVMALIAVLHITESILIAISGRYGAVPIILRRTDGQLVGAFNLQNFWPLPLVVSAVTAVSGNISPNMVNMPDWWPLLTPGMVLPDGQEWLYSLLPVVAALGYGDIAVATKPGIRRQRSAVYLALYSIILLALAIAAEHAVWLQFIAAMFSPLGHEWLIRFDNHQEMKGAPRYVPPLAGLKVLAVLPDTPAQLAGIQTEDIILSIGGMAVNNKRELGDALSFAGSQFHMELQRQGKSFFIKVDVSRQCVLGIIPVPEGNELYYTIIRDSRFFLLHWLKQKLQKKR